MDNPLKRWKWTMPAVACIATVFFASSAWAQANPTATPGAAAEPGPGPAVGAAELDPTTLMPADTLVYLNVNLAAGRAYLQQIKGTRLGQAFQAALDDQKGGKGGPNLATLSAMTQGFGSQIGVSIRMPANTALAANGAPPANPDVLAAIPVADINIVRPEDQLITGFLGAQGNVKWKDEPEGDNTVHVTGDPDKPGNQEIAYALTPRVLLISTSPPMVHHALKLLAGPQPATDSPASTPGFQALANRVDRGQFLWGYSGKYDTAAMMGGLNAAAKAAGPAAKETEAVQKLLQSPVMKDYLAAYQGTVFSLGLRPDSVLMQSVSGIDADSHSGKLIRTLQGNPLTAPGLAGQKSVGFAEVTDMPHFVQVWDSLVQPMFDSVMQSIAEDPNAGANPAAAGMKMVTGILDPIAQGCGNEFALAVGPVTAMANGIPSITVMLQDANDPRLNQGIQKVLGMAANGDLYAKNLMGTDVQVAGAATSPFRPTHAKIHGFHVLAADLASMKTPVFLGQGQGQSLDQSTAFQHTTGLLGNQDIFLMYVDLQQLIHTFAGNAANGKKPVGMTVGAVPGNPPAARAAGKPEDRLAHQFVSSIGQLGVSYNPDPAGLATRMVVTYDPNAPLLPGL